MKKYKRIIIIITVLYALAAAGLFWYGQRAWQHNSREYRVEINRLSAQLLTEYEKTGRLDTDVTGEYVTRITWLAMSDNEADKLMDFFSPDNGTEYQLEPVYEGENLIGYLRYDYIADKADYRLLIVAESVLLVMYFITFVVLIYTEMNIVKPFNEISSMPEELSKGNYAADLKENKNRYFGRFIWGIGMLKDTLDSHRRQELRLARDKKMILLSVSHDIKTPLNAINLYAQALEQDIYSEPVQIKEAAAHIQEKTREIDSFVKEIIRSSTEEVVVIKVNNIDFYLNDVIGKIYQSYFEKCSLRRLELTIGDHDNYMLHGDPDRLYEAISNLMENAMKYGDGRNINIDISVEEYCVLIAVSNTGAPVEDKDMSHLFDSFYRGSNASGKEGSGLGLYICSEIMHKMEGDIYAEKTENGMSIVLVCPMS